MQIEMKPYRQTWLKPEVLHSAPSAILFTDSMGTQWAQLEHPMGGSLTCIRNRSGKVATGVVKENGKWFFVIPDD